MQIKIEEITQLNVVNFWCENNFTHNDSPILVTDKDKERYYFTANIFQITDIEYCLFCNNLLAVKFSNFTEQNKSVYSLIMAEIDDFFAEKSTILNISDTSVSKKDLVEAISNSLIRPTLLRDKGNIEILSFEDNNLKIKFTGHCAGCPYAERTLNNVISKVILRHIPQVDKVILSEE